MISIKCINEKDIDLCYELDSNTLSLWTKQQWAKEFKKSGTVVVGLLISNLLLWQNSLKEFSKEFLCINYMLSNTALAHFAVLLFP